MDIFARGLLYSHNQDVLSHNQDALFGAMKKEKTVTFALDNRLLEDSVEITDLKLSQLRLMNDARFPWVLLIPKRDNIYEIFELTTQEQNILFAEISQVGHVMTTVFQADKMNIAALGNMVRQLHVHIIARFHDDAAWPNPVWGQGTAMPYEQALLRDRCELLLSQIAT